jgi:hypothetical protein
MELDHAFERQFIAAYYVECYIIMWYYTPNYPDNTANKVQHRTEAEVSPRLNFHCQHEW